MPWADLLAAAKIELGLPPPEPPLVYLTGIQAKGFVARALRAAFPGVFFYLRSRGSAVLVEYDGDADPIDREALAGLEPKE